MMTEYVPLKGRAGILLGDFYYLQDSLQVEIADLVRSYRKPEEGITFSWLTFRISEFALSLFKRSQWDLVKQRVIAVSVDQDPLTVNAKLDEIYQAHINSEVAGLDLRTGETPIKPPSGYIALSAGRRLQF